MSGSRLDWEGATVVILASGPSLSVEQCAVVRLWREQDRRNHKVIAINTTFRRAPWADVIYACDAPWWNVYAGEARSACEGELWTQDKPTAIKYGLRWIPSCARQGLSQKPGLINQNSNSGAQAIGLAYDGGARRLVLLGFDMHGRNGTHWHGAHPQGLDPKMLFDVWLRRFDILSRDLEAAGVEVINATPNSALHHFNRADLLTALGLNEKERAQCLRS